MFLLGLGLPFCSYHHTVLNHEFLIWINLHICAGVINVPYPTIYLQLCYDLCVGGSSITEPWVLYSSYVTHTHSLGPQDGELCISILHPPGEDPHSGELPAERWNPTQSVRWAGFPLISLFTASRFSFLLYKCANRPNVHCPSCVTLSTFHFTFAYTLVQYFFHFL